MGYKDDFGDVWTTSAVTTYYQARIANGNLDVGPHQPDGTKITSTPFFMDPDFRNDDAAIVNVDGNNAKGTAIADVYKLKAGSGANAKVQFSFEPSFIGEQVNASIQALPNDVVRYSYVHTVFNYAKDQDQVFIYPSMGVPKFKSLAGKTLAVGTAGTGKIAYDTGSGYCSPDASFLTSSGSTCANIGLFITIPEPKGTKEMTVNYKFKTMIRTNKGNVAPKDFKPSEYDVTYGPEVSNINGGTNALVSVGSGLCA